MKTFFNKLLLISIISTTYNCSEDQNQLVEKAVTARKQGNYQEAYTHLKKAEKIKDNEVVYKEIGNYFLEYKNDYNEAEKYYQKSLSIQPDYVNAMHNMGLLNLKRYENSNDAPGEDNHNYLKEAEKWLQMAMEKDKNFGLSYAEYGRMLFYKQQYESSIQYLLKALKLNADPQHVHNILGQVYLLGIQDNKSALDHFEKAYNQYSTDPQFLKMLALAHKNLEHKQEAENYYKRYLERLHQLKAPAEVIQAAEKDKSNYLLN